MLSECHQALHEKEKFVTMKQKTNSLYTALTSHPVTSAALNENSAVPRPANLLMHKKRIGQLELVGVVTEYPL